MSLKDEVRKVWNFPNNLEEVVAKHEIRKAMLNFRDVLGLDGLKDGEWIELDSKNFKEFFDNIFGDWKE